ncbi:MAG: lipopolysaccharide kinase InaA family protein [Phycisphaerae bacterium]
MATSHAIQIRLGRVELREGWSATVLTGLSGTLPDGAALPRLPGIERWRAMLDQLIEDRSALVCGESFKYSSAGEVRRVSLPSQDGPIELVCKHARVRGLRRRLCARVGVTRERANFHRALKLLRAGVATALPLALMRSSAPGRESWLLTRFVPDLVDLDWLALTWLPQAGSQQARLAKNAIIVALVTALERMERSGLRHRDLKASNILLSHWEGPPADTRVWIMDVEGLRRDGRWKPGTRRRQLARLGASLLSYASITRSDYARFLRTYLTALGLTEKPWRRHYRTVAQRASSYARRSQRRKSHKLDGYEGSA